MAPSLSLPLQSASFLSVGLTQHSATGSETLLDDLSAAIDEFDASVAETTGGTMDHVLARAELMLSDEVMRLVGLLDEINRYRSDRVPQLLVAWKSAKRVGIGAAGGGARWCRSLGSRRRGR
jgi:hypothetical protein